MRFLGYEIRKATKTEINNFTAWNSNTPTFLSSRSKPMLLSTVYRCVDLISDSIGVLPLKTYKIDKDGFKTEDRNHPAYYILDLEPNENMTRYVFMKTLMTSVLLTGNGYAYIDRDKNNSILQLVYIPTPACSIVWVTDSQGAKRKRYKVTGFSDLVEPKDMIHVLNFTYDGIIGVSTLEHARQTIDIATLSEEHAKGFLKSGAATSGVLTVEGTRMSKEQKDQVYKTWSDRTDPVTGHPNGITILEGNMKYQPISISPKDSQLLESRQFNVVDICRFFSVSPVKAFDLSKSSYSTVEATQLQYLTDTALAVITKIEQEINRKIFMPAEWGKEVAEFNTSAILRTDKAAQASYWRNMFQTASATPNEIRREMNLPKIENGDKPFIQVNMQTLDNAIKEKVSDTQMVNKKDDKTTE